MLERSVLADVDGPALMLRLAKGELEFELTPLQRACGVRPHLAYMASLCLPAGAAPPFDAEAEKAFGRLQVWYHQALSSLSVGPAERPAFFKLSPALAPQLAPLAPAAEAQAAQREADEAQAAQLAAAEGRARQAEAQLLELLAREESAAAAAPPMAAARRPRRAAAASRRGGGGRGGGAGGEGSAGGGGASSGGAGSGDSVDVSIEELTAGRTTLLDEAGFDADEWTQVRHREARARGARGEASGGAAGAQRLGDPGPRDCTRRPASAAAAASVGTSVAAQPLTRPVAADLSAEFAGLRAVVEGGELAGGGGRGSGMVKAAAAPAATAAAAAAAAPVAAPAPAPAPVAAAAPAEAPATKGTGEAPPAAAAAAAAAADEASAGEVARLRREVESLRTALDARDATHKAELSAARASHSSALAGAVREAQERAEKRLQALQLRLYISNTRLQTLEGALAQFVEEVGPLPSREADSKPTALTLAMRAAAGRRSGDEEDEGGPAYEADVAPTALTLAMRGAAGRRSGDEDDGDGPAQSSWA